MDLDPKNPLRDSDLLQQDVIPTSCSKEAIDQALIGWPPADHCLEQIMDRAERQP